MYDLKDFAKLRNELLRLEDIATRVELELWMEGVARPYEDTKLMVQLRIRLLKLTVERDAVKAQIVDAYMANLEGKELHEIYG